MRLIPPARKPGQIFILAAVAFPVLLLVTGVAIDMGFMYARHRELQEAADAAALAGAQGLGRNYQFTFNIINPLYSGGCGNDGTQECTNSYILGDMKQAVVSSMPPFPAPPTGANASAPSVVSTGSIGAGEFGMDAYYVYTATEKPGTGISTATGSDRPPANNNGDQPVGTRAVVSFKYPTFFMKLAGFDTITLTASGRALLRPLAGSPGAAPFILCGGGPNAYGTGPYIAPNPTPVGSASNTPLTIIQTPTPSGAVEAKPTYVNTTFVVHWSQLAQNNADCIGNPPTLTSTPTTPPGQPSPTRTPTPTTCPTATYTPGPAPKSKPPVAIPPNICGPTATPTPGGGGGGNSADFKGLAQAGATCVPTGGSALPCTLAGDNGTQAGPTNQIIAGLPACAGNQDTGCVMLLPIADQCTGGGNSISCNIVTWMPFYITDGSNPSAPQQGCNSNCHLAQMMPAALVDAPADSSRVFDPNAGGLATIQLAPD